VDPVELNFGLQFLEEANEMIAVFTQAPIFELLYIYKGTCPFAPIYFSYLLMM